MHGTSLPSPMADPTRCRRERRRRGDRRPGSSRGQRQRHRSPARTGRERSSRQVGPWRRPSSRPSTKAHRRVSPLPPRHGPDGAGSRRGRASRDKDERRTQRLFRCARAARMLRAARQRASADAKRADAVLNDRTRNDPSDLTGFTCSGSARQSSAQRQRRHAPFPHRGLCRPPPDRPPRCGFRPGSRKGSDPLDGRRRLDRRRRAGRCPKPFRAARNALATARRRGMRQANRRASSAGGPVKTPRHRQKSFVCWGKDAAVPGDTAAPRSGRAQATHVVFSQLAAAVDSLCDVPGFGQLGGAVMSRIGIVMIDFGSQTGKSYWGSFFVMPITASL